MKTLLKIGFWILSLTWGLIMTALGIVVSLFCIIFLKGKPHRNGFSFIVELGGNWGGLDMGAISLCGRYSQVDGPCYSLNWYEHVRRHEFGHAIQNIIWGPLFPFVIGIPSAIRYHYHHYRSKKGLPNRDYDAIWFEGQATRWGTWAIDKIEK